VEAVTTEEVETITIERQSTQILCRIQMLLISIRGKDLIESKEKKIKDSLIIIEDRAGGRIEVEGTEAAIEAAGSLRTKKETPLHLVTQHKTSD